MSHLKARAVRGSGPGAARLRLLEAAEVCLLRDGYAALSTRSVAEAASMPLSQIHYHFGSKQGLVLALLEHQNQKLLRRQAETFGRDAPLSDRWLQACDHLEEDLRSGYVRVLQEIIAAGYSDPQFARAAREMLNGWFVLLSGVAEEGLSTLGVRSVLTAPEIACLIGAAFMGAESSILIGMDVPIRSALRGIGEVLRNVETSKLDAECMRAEEPSVQGWITRDGVRVAYEVYGVDGPTVVLLPSWIIVHDRSWKAQIADFAQDCRVVVIEGRGNGLSDRPAGWEHYTHTAYIDDALAVMDELGVGDCVLLGLSMGGPRTALLAQRRPDQVKAIVMIAPTGPLNEAQRDALRAGFTAPENPTGHWYNAAYMQEDYEAFLRRFFAIMFPEKHSTKQIQDGVAWGLETTAQCVIDSTLGSLAGEADLEAAYAAVRCPTLVFHGDADQIVPIGTGRRVAEATRAEWIEVPGSGHGPNIRHPAYVNGEIRRFLQQHGLLAPKPAKRRSPRQAPRALYLSSPIGLGHARRDLAITRALKELQPGLAVDWLAQDPVTRLLAGAGETLHPASARLASESSHIEDEAGEHDLNVFQALRNMDEILVRNFRVFQDVVETDRYDLVIADEGWEVDHFWHEHPGLKRAPLVWMTDFVGFAPMAEGGAPEAALTADYNGEMVGHVEQHPGVRDRAIFVGNPDDVVDDALGPDLPGRRAWVDARFAYSGYILGDGVPRADQKAALRARLGFAPGEKVCVVTVGGSGVGEPLIRRILAALPLARRRHPELRTIVVTGPRLKAGAFPPVPGVEFRGFQPALPELLAACDLALVQGGLSTCMELAATRTPFIYFPLQRHFEQNVHVARRLDAYGAGRRLFYAQAGPDEIATAIDEELAAGEAPWRDVERDGAARAARLIAELL